MNDLRKKISPSISWDTPSVPPNQSHHAQAKSNQGFNNEDTKDAEVF